MELDRLAVMIGQVNIQVLANIVFEFRGTQVGGIGTIR